MQSVCEDSVQLELSYIVGGNPKWHSHTGKVWQFLIKLNMHLPYDPRVPLLVIYHAKNYIYTQIYTFVFIEALFIITKSKNNPNILQDLTG